MDEVATRNQQAVAEYEATKAENKQAAQRITQERLRLQIEQTEQRIQGNELYAIWYDEKGHPDVAAVYWRVAEREQAVLVNLRAAIAASTGGDV